MLEDGDSKPGTRAIFVAKSKQNDFPSWEIANFNNEYFYFRHTKSKRILTAKSNITITIEGKGIHIEYGMYNIFTILLIFNL